MVVSPPTHRSQTAIFGRILWWLFPLAIALLLTAGLATILTSLPAQAAGPICYVDADATGAVTGLNWTDAYTTVQDALADAACTEIWVAEGVYYPDEGAGQTNGIVTSTFVLTNGVALYGGFEGTEITRTERDPATNITVLSGDIDQNDVTDANGVVTDTAKINGDNAYHVVTGSGTDSTAVLDGFTITAGKSGFFPNSSGSGMYNDAGSPALRNIIFSGNLASHGVGGGMYNKGNSSPMLTDITFSNNSAFRGGGMYNYNSSNPALNNVIFSDNSASYNGGGMYNNNSSPMLTDVTFSGNSSTSNGGGMCNENNSSPTLTKVAFSYNSVSGNNSYGGGMYNNNSNPALNNVTFSHNSVSGSDSYGGGMYNYNSNPALSDVAFSYNLASYNGGGMYNYNSRPALNNVTFSHNSASVGDGGGMYNHNSSPALTNVTFSDNSAFNNGGGMYNNDSSFNFTLTNVTFSGNWTYIGNGGGMYNNNSDPALTNASFSDNSANNDGGGMYNYDSNPTLTNATFSGNSADHDGGGMYNHNSSSELTNATFFSNLASNDGGGMYNTGSNYPVLTNVIIANSAYNDCVGSADFISTHNLIEDSAYACGLTSTGGNIIGFDPKLGTMTDYGGPGKQVFPLLVGSPAIDAGTNFNGGTGTNCPATDQRGASRPVDGDGDDTARCDIGAFEIGYSLTISKQVDDSTPLPGQTITFTVIVTSTELTVTHGLLSDTLPAGLNFLGPITLEPSGAGEAGTSLPTLASGLTISNSQRITVTFPVTVSWGLAAGTSLTNTATISATQVPTPTWTSTVVTVDNAPPTADAGIPQRVDPGDTVTLDGSASGDPNGDALTYRWVQTGGVTVALSDAMAVSPTFTAPITAGMVLTFSLTVTDTGNSTDTAITTVTVEKYRLYLPLVLKH